ncbi:hypothetical protein BB559_007486, partial [Furculomyces boomerangus]
MENSTTQYSDSGGNCGFLNLGFDILSNIFIESMNEKLIKVSKIFYEISQNASVQLRIYLKWIESKDIDDKDCDHHYSMFHLNDMLKELKILENHKFVVGLIKNDPFNLFYKHIFRRAIKNQNIKVLKVLLNGSRIKKIRESNNELELIPYEKRQLYTVEPLIDINETHFEYVAFGTLETLEIVKNAHKIKINVEKDHGITSDMGVGYEKYVSIHRPLEKNAILKFHAGIKKFDLETVKLHFENVDIDEDDFNTAFEVYSKSQCLTVVKFLIDYGIKRQFQLSRWSLILLFAYNTNEIIQCVTEAIEKYVGIYRLMKYAIYIQNKFWVNYFLSKGVEIRYNNYQILKQAISNKKTLSILCLLDRIDLSDLDIEIQKSLILSTDTVNSEYLSALINKGIDIHLDDDKMFRIVAEETRSFEKDLALMKRLLDLGTNVYANKSIYLKNVIKYNPTMAIVILKHSHKPHPNSNLLFKVACNCGIHENDVFDKNIEAKPSKIKEIVKLILSKEEGLAKKNKHLFFVLLQHERFELCNPFL